MTRPETAALLVVVFLSVTGIYYWTLYLPQGLVFFAGLASGLVVAAVMRRVET